MRGRLTVMARWAVVCAGLFQSVPVSAAMSTAAVNPSQFATPSTASEALGVLQLTGSLLVVLSVVFAATWALRRLQLPGRVDHRHLQVLAQVSLGARERAVLVQVGGKQLLLGVAAGAVTTLHVLDEPLAMALSDERGVDFKAVLLRSLGRS